MSASDGTVIVLDTVPLLPETRENCCVLPVCVIVLVPGVAAAFGLTTMAALTPNDLDWSQYRHRHISLQTAGKFPRHRHGGWR